MGLKVIQEIPEQEGALVLRGLAGNVLTTSRVQGVKKEVKTSTIALGVEETEPTGKGGSKNKKTEISSEELNTGEYLEIILVEDDPTASPRNENVEDATAEVMAETEDKTTIETADGEGPFNESSSDKTAEPVFVDSKTNPLLEHASRVTTDQKETKPVDDGEPPFENEAQLDQTKTVSKDQKENIPDNIATDIPDSTDLESSVFESDASKSSVLDKSEIKHTDKSLHGKKDSQDLRPTESASNTKTSMSTKSGVDDKCDKLMPQHSNSSDIGNKAKLSCQENAPLDSQSTDFKNDPCLKRDWRVKPEQFVRSTDHEDITDITSHSSDLNENTIKKN